MKWREIGPYLRELWHRPAGPMNWKNPIRVFAVLGWLIVQGFVLLGWAGWRVFQGLMLLGWTVFRVAHFVVRLPALLLFFLAVCGTPCGALYGVPSRRLMSTRSLLWCNSTPPISSRSWCCGTTFRPSLPSCCAGLFPSPFGRSGSRGGGAISRPSPSSRRGRFHRTKRLRLSSSEKSITRSRRGRFLVPRGSPSRSADCIPAWRSSEPWDRGKHRLA